MDHVYDLLMTFFNTQAHTIAFPELSVPATMVLKKFVKDCKVSSFCSNPFFAYIGNILVLKPQLIVKNFGNKAVGKIKTTIFKKTPIADNLH